MSETALYEFQHATLPLASYACHPLQSRGRLVPEEENPYRSCYQRDRDRIIHSTAFRRLEYKTQVFVNHEGDHYRTRLTHSLEVAQLARSISRVLGLNEDLAEALALAHDLGHTPFGHAGEDGLDEAMKEYGGFDHNAQTLRILTKLERRYAKFDGLNLTWETLEGIAKHNGPLLRSPEDKEKLPRAIVEYAALHDLELESFASAEAQVASLADDIAYNNHDIDDGLRARLFTIEEVCEIPHIGEMFDYVRQKHPNIDRSRLIHEAVRRLINCMVKDLVTTTLGNIRRHSIESVEQVRSLGEPLVHFSHQMQEQNRQLKSFLMKRMYRHYRVNRMSSKARRVVRELFTFFMNEPNCLPPEWQEAAMTGNEKHKAYVIGDYIAGMTDRFALEEHTRVYDVTAKG
jgi:dGTPase